MCLQVSAPPRVYKATQLQACAPSLPIGVNHLKAFGLTRILFVPYHHHLLRDLGLFDDKQVPAVPRITSGSLKTGVYGPRDRQTIHFT